LNLGHWDLFEPALARLDWLIASSAVGFQLELIDTAGVNPVWARDLDFGAWNFGDFSFFRVSIFESRIGGLSGLDYPVTIGLMVSEPMAAMRSHSSLNIVSSR